MKTIRMISACLFCGLLLSLSTGAFAQDAMKAASNVAKKVILENEKVRVIQVEYAPGEVAQWHSHPDHVVYALNDAKLEITDKGKPARTLEFKAGEAKFMPAVTHMIKNVGTAPAKMVVTELKAAK